MEKPQMPRPHRETKAEGKARAKAYDAINRLRHRYRCADGDEATLRAEIIRLSAETDYPAKANDELFYGCGGTLPVWGFGCWKPGPDRGGISPFRTAKQKETST
jgi:hypothetical protein